MIDLGLRLGLYESSESIACTNFEDRVSSVRLDEGSIVFDDGLSVVEQGNGLMGKKERMNELKMSLLHSHEAQPELT